MGLSQERLHGSRTYRNYLRPLDIEYTMVACLPVRDGFTHDLGFTRTEARTAFDSDDCDLLNSLVPHLRRAFEISRVLEERAAPIQLKPAVCDPVALQSALALTPTQARLAALLFNGRTVKDAASDLCITENTARQYLKMIFDRTGAKRQLDLIRMIERALSQDT